GNLVDTLWQVCPSNLERDRKRDNFGSRVGSRLADGDFSQDAEAIFEDSLSPRVVVENLEPDCDIARWIAGVGGPVVLMGDCLAVGIRPHVDAGDGHKDAVTPIG